MTFCHLGYIGNYAILETIEHFVQKLKATNPDLVYGKSIDQEWKKKREKRHSCGCI